MSSEDKIHIRNLHADVLIGIYPEEKEIQQPVVINITLITDCALPARTDNIEDAVDYSLIHDEVFNHLHSTQYDLIETLAENVASICLKDTRIRRCTVSVDKPDALEYAESVAIEITRSNV